MREKAKWLWFLAPALAFAALVAAGLTGRDLAFASAGGCVGLFAMVFAQAVARGEESESRPMNLKFVLTEQEWRDVEDFREKTKSPGLERQYRTVLDVIDRFVPRERS